MTADANLVARKMLAEDARWILDVLMSAGQDEQLGGIIPLLLAGHAARIDYEGSLFARTKTAGVAPLAELLRPKYAATTTRARHAMKLFDDDAKTYDEVLDLMRAYLAAHTEEFGGRVRLKWARRLAPDLGSYWLDGNVLGISPTILFRLGQPPDFPFDRLGPTMFALSREWGGELLVLSAVETGVPWDQRPTVSYAALHSLTDGDKFAHRYLPTRFEGAFPPELRLALLHIQGELNTARLVIPTTAQRHEDAALRATVVTVYPALRTLHHVSDTYPDLHTPGMARLRGLLDSTEVRHLLDDHGRHVRNRSTHYRIPGATATSPLLDTAIPFNGIVEALPGGRPLAEYRAELTEALDAAAALLNTWSPT